MNIVVTGGAGLVGTECCKLFSERGYNVVSVDNYKRGDIFGQEGSTEENARELIEDYGIDHRNMDVRDKEMRTLIKNSDAVVHTAAQPSHPKSIDIPMKDFQINTLGTLKLLEWIREYNEDASFIFCSTNKVYGEMPNFFSYEKVGKRFEPKDPTLWDGFDETLRVDQNMHTPFGVSKASADFYAQEYGKLYGLNTGRVYSGWVVLLGGQLKQLRCTTGSLIS